MLDHGPQVGHFSDYGAKEVGLLLEEGTGQVKGVEAALASQPTPKAMVTVPAY